MAVAKIQGATASTDNVFSGTTTPGFAYPSAVTAGNTLIGTYNADTGSTVSSVSDTVNGAWTLAVGPPATPNQNVYQYYKSNTGSGTPTVTFNVNNSNNGCTITLWEISGASNPVVDVTSSNKGSSSVPNAGNLVTTKANAFLLTNVEDSSGNQTVGAGWTLFDCENGFQFSTTQYRIVSATGTYSPAFNTNTGGSWTATAVAYGETGGAAEILLGISDFEKYLRRYLNDGLSTSQIGPLEEIASFSETDLIKYLRRYLNDKNA